ncbi:MAG: amidohydrolase [Spirochaetes bacterium]|nr:MAG: amidohydrolase [Spirochaetota bacterium]
MEIIDIHVHITPPEIIRDEMKYRRREPHFDLLCSNPANKFVTAKRLIDHMDETGVAKSIVFGFAFRDMELCRFVNDYTLEAIRSYPERLYGFAVINPLHGDAERELERCISLGMVGLGELLPWGQEFDIADKKSMEKICTLCAENEIPVMVHVNELVGHYYPGKGKVSIVEAETLARNFPHALFILSHMGGGLSFYELMPEVRENLKNVYYDTAAVPFLYDKRLYEVVKTAGLLEKTLFGSDYPLLSPSKYLKDLENTSLSASEKAKILGGNVKKIVSVKQL